MQCHVLRGPYWSAPYRILTLLDPVHQSPCTLIAQNPYDSFSRFKGATQTGHLDAHILIDSGLYRRHALGENRPDPSRNLAENVGAAIMLISLQKTNSLKDEEKMEAYVVTRSTSGEILAELQNCYQHLPRVAEAFAHMPIHIEAGAKGEPTDLESHVQSLLSQQFAPREPGQISSLITSARTFLLRGLGYL